MRNLAKRIGQFFFPPADTPGWARVLPYAILGVLTLVGLVAFAYTWDYTNSPEFCGTSCHTMPPEYTSYLASPHARVDCVECHIGRGFIATRITRKAGDIKHIFSLAFKRYEFPIRAKTLRPAREICERCHNPEKFSDDSLREITHFGDDVNNTPTTIYLTVKTGGGTRRQGLGRGIHWHVENEVFYLATDPGEQNIPYVQVIDDEGVMTEYIALDSDIDPSTVDPDDLRLMDCISCHNRITHIILAPEDTVDQLIARGEVSPALPSIRFQAVNVLGRDYKTTEEAMNSIAGLFGYYSAIHPDLYANPDTFELINQAVTALQNAYTSSVFPEQQADWMTHSNNVGHRFTPGCFRCHDGQHLNPAGESIRLECNLCHSIPVVADADDFIAKIEISRGPEPENHLHANWIGLHRDIFDATCSNCHTTEDPGGTSNTSFCSNSSCHGVAWEFAGFDAPGLREILSEQIPPTPTPAPEGIGPATYVDTIGPLLTSKCGHCHGETGLRGLDLTMHASILEGGESGPAIVPYDAEASLIVQVQNRESGHFAQLSPDEMEALIEWIASGAP